MSRTSDPLMPAFATAHREMMKEPRTILPFPQANPKPSEP